MMLYMRPDGSVGMGPDMIRLKNRFEVPNGRSEVTDLLTNMRTLSYVSIMGDNEHTQAIKAKLNINTETIQWFEPALLQTATAARY